MTSEEKVETSEAQFAVHWKEEKYFHPSPRFIAQANMSDPAIFDRFQLKYFPTVLKKMMWAT